MIAFELPLRTKSGNAGHGREHWGARLRRVKKERDAVRLLWPRRQMPETLRFPLAVTLIRIKPRGADLDSDNLCAALKGCRDQVAEQFGVDDGDTARIRFEYAEEKGPWGVRVEIREAMP